MTISEATCCEECPYFTRSKTKVQNANRPEVQLHKMDAKLVDDQSGAHLVDWLKSEIAALYDVKSQDESLFD